MSSAKKIRFDTLPLTRFGKVLNQAQIRPILADARILFKLTRKTVQSKEFYSKQRKIRILDSGRWVFVKPERVNFRGLGLQRKVKFLHFS